MTDRRYDVITACNGDADTCTSFRTGHNTHTVQATLAGRAPQGWRVVTVDDVSGQLVTLRPVDGTEQIELWHHRPLDAVLAEAGTVRLHTAQALLEVDSRWISVAVAE